MSRPKVWDGTAWVNQATRSPVWAWYDALTATYAAAQMPPGKLPSPAELKALADACSASGDEFNYVLKARKSVSEFLSMIADAGRCIWRQAIDRLHLLPDAPRTIPNYMITDAEIIAGSHSVSYRMPTSDRADGAVITYVDEDADFAPATLTYPFDVVPQKPVRVDLPGVTKRSKVAAYAALLALHNVAVASEARSLTVEQDAKFWLRGDIVAVASHQFGADIIKGQARVIARSGNTLTLDVPPVWQAGAQHYIEIRSGKGRVLGPVACDKGASDVEVVLNAASLAAVAAATTAQRSADGEPNVDDTLDKVLARADGAIDPIVAISTQASRRFVVVGRRPGNNGRNEVSLVPYEPALYTQAAAAAASTPPRLDVPQLVVTGVPFVTNLTAVWQPAIVGSALYVGWTADARAVRYLVEISYDNGATWTPQGEVTATGVQLLLPYPGACVAGVTAINAQGVRGPRATVAVAAGDDTVRPSPGSVSLPQLGADAAALYDQIEQQRVQVFDAIRVAGEVQNHYRQRVEARIGKAVAFYDQQIDVLADADAAAASRVTTLEAQVSHPTTGLPATLARLVEEETVRASAIAAEAAARTALAATVNHPTTGLAAAHAAVSNEAAARVSGDAAEATARAALATAINHPSTGLAAAHSAISTEATTRANADSALSTSLGTLSAQVNAPGTGLPAAHAAISSEATTRAAADTALANYVDTVLASYDGTMAGAKFQMTAVAAPAGVAARIEMQVRAANTGGGDATNWKQAGIIIDVLETSPGSGVYTTRILNVADKYYVVNGTTMLPAFEVDTVNNRVKMKAADIGTVVAGIVKRADDKVIFNLNTGTLKVFDATGTLRVHIGDLSA